MKEPIWTGPARNDLTRIDDFLRNVDPVFASRVGQSAIKAGRFLSVHPQAGPVIAKRIRKWNVSGTEYLLLYRVKDGAVNILRVHHGREDWWPQ